MVEKIFWHDPYQTTLETHIASVDGNEITVAETIFFAFSGGQESDTGTIGGYDVLDARTDGQEIIYTLPDNHSLQVGDRVTMTIDWERRYRLMRLHFAAEIILELTYRQLKPIEKIGAHIAEDKSRIDFLHDSSIKAAFPQLLDAAHDIITADEPILSAFSDEANERRYWKIDSFAQVACGGTHLKRTGEVGTLRLKRKNIGKGKERIEIYVD